MWTTRKTLIGALALALSLVLAAPAQAALTEKRARSLAVKLARQVANDRDALFWDLSPAAKVRSTRVVFFYSERTPDQFFCTAKLVVTESGRTRRAALSSQRCRAVPEQVLEIERATRSTIRAVRARSTEVRRSFAAFERDSEECTDLEPPSAVADEIALLLAAGLELALHEPVLAELEAHASRLEAIGVSDRELAAGVVSWARWARVLRTFPPVARDACEEVRRWASEDYDPEATPLDFVDLNRAVEIYERQVRRMRRASVRLAELGASPQVVDAFTPEQLVVVWAL
jgi:hypothetical protein